jgi:hypothetical protein
VGRCDNELESGMSEDKVVRRYLTSCWKNVDESSDSA